MPTFELFIIAVLGLIAWFWLDTLRAREAGISAARQLCDKRNLQLLDDTVASNPFVWRVTTRAGWCCGACTASSSATTATTGDMVR